MAKFNSVVGALDASTIEDLQDIIRDKPATDPYKALKDAIIKRTTESPDFTLLKLLTNLELGDSKPSQLWRRMKSMAGDKILDPALKVMWLALLPKPAQTYLSVFKVDSVDELLEAADKLIHHNTQVSSVNPAENISCASSGYSTPTREVNPIQQQLAALQTTMAQLIALTRQSLEMGPQASQRNNSQRGRGRARSNSRQRGRSPANRPDWCWYHNKYGASAINCTKPCSFKPSMLEN